MSLPPGRLQRSVLSRRSHASRAVEHSDRSKLEAGCLAEWGYVRRAYRDRCRRPVGSLGNRSYRPILCGPIESRGTHTCLAPGGWAAFDLSVHAAAGLSGARRLSIEAMPLRRHTTAVVRVSGADICCMRPGPSRKLLANAEVASLGGRQRRASGAVGGCGGKWGSVYWTLQVKRLPV